MVFQTNGQMWYIPTSLHSCDLVLSFPDVLWVVQAREGALWEGDAGVLSSRPGSLLRGFHPSARPRGSDTLPQPADEKGERLNSQNCSCFFMLFGAWRSWLRIQWNCWQELLGQPITLANIFYVPSQDVSFQYSITARFSCLRTDTSLFRACFSQRRSQLTLMFF